MTLDKHKFLNIPPKLMPIITQFNNYRYILLEGGRGSAKSWSVAQFILFLCEQKKLRVICGREIQNSIEESVYQLLVDFIVNHNLDFDVTKSQLTHRTTGSTIRFKGFREQGAVSLKSMEGCDVLWCEESQSITKPTLNIITPTIRKENAKVFFTMNRFKRADPVYEFCSDKKSALKIHIDYFENPYCPRALQIEAEDCKSKDMNQYNHIWLGQPLDEIDNYLFTNENLDACQKFEFYHNEALYGNRIGAFDIARMGSDHCAFVVIEQKGPVQWEEIYTETWKKKDLAHTTGRIIDRIGKFKLDISVVDGDGMGAGPRDIADFFLNAPKSIIEFRANKTSPDDINVSTGQRRAIRRHTNIKSWSWHQVKDMIENSWLKINSKDIIGDLQNIMYDFKPNGERFIISKEKMKAQGMKSPDIGDSLMMAVSEIRNINKVYDTKISNLPRYTQQDDAEMMGQQMMRGLPTHTVGM